MHSGKGPLPPGPEITAEPQIGAVPWRVSDGQRTYLLITSRGTGKWLFPKGSIIEGLAPWETAAEEAREEAGIDGQIDREPVGTYRDWKTRNGGRAPIEVTLFPMRVTAQHDTWKESGSRQRQWATYAEARELLSSPGLVEMIDEMERRLARDSR